jgi:transformation/transcription domain-associated protein
MPEVIAKIFGDEYGNGNEDSDDLATAATPHSASAGQDVATPGSAGGSTSNPPPSAPPLSARSITSTTSFAGSLPEAPPIRKLAPGMKSLKLLAECPIAVVFLFQTYRDIVPNELRVFVPLVFQFLELQAAPQAKAHELAQQRGETFIGICPALQQSRRTQFTDLIVAEVKTMSFVAYFLRMSAAALQKYKDTIPELVVRLLKDCPSEGASHRKVCSSCLS